MIKVENEEKGEKQTRAMQYKVVRVRGEGEVKGRFEPIVREIREYLENLTKGEIEE